MLTLKKAVKLIVVNTVFKDTDFHLKAQIFSLAANAVIFLDLFSRKCQ